MKLDLNYGKGQLRLELADKNVQGLLLPQEKPGANNPLAEVRRALEQPTGTPPLAELVSSKKPRQVAIVVNDITRPTPYKYLLPPVLEILADSGLTPDQVVFIIATGIHRGHTEAENSDIFGAGVTSRYRFINHDCTDNLVLVGHLSDGRELAINREVAEADLVITTGLIGLHYFAGYSGGRKSILPGVAAKELITHNHARMTDPRATTGNYRDNPVHHIMTEAARMAGVDFILNAVTNSDKGIVKIVAGDLEEAWLEGVRICEEMNVIPLDNQAEVVIASAGGYPKDIDVYQSQKAMDAADPACRDGGTIILVAECREGFGGEATFEEWVRQARSLDDILERFAGQFVLGGHKAFAIARVLKEKEVVLVSSLSQRDAHTLFFHPAASLDEALDYVRKKHGPDYKALVMPQAGLIMPVLKPC